MYTVKDIARITDTSEHTVRFYTDKGLIPGVSRDHNNKRLFSEESINWFNGVKFLKEGGMPIKDIKEYVDLCLEGSSTILTRYEIILKQQQLANEKLEQTKKLVAYMDHKVEYYQELLNENEDKMNPATWTTKETEKT